LVTRQPLLRPRLVELSGEVGDPPMSKADHVRDDLVGAAFVVHFQITDAGHHFAAMDGDERRAARKDFAKLRRQLRS
jgi:hypothetical protein